MSSTKKVKLELIKLNPNNPRLIKDDKFKKLVQSIVDFPQMLEIRPIVVNTDMIILGGNMRYKACKEAGIKEVPVIIADNLTEEQQKEFLIKDNTSGGEWDWEVLANEWDAVSSWKRGGLDIPSKTFDCFAGDSVFGYVSSYLGNNFTGIELRQEQANLNNQRVKGFQSKYICDDGQNVLNHIEPNSQDLLFSCPPYFDLEVYSDMPNDASNQKEYSDFLKILDNAFTDAIKCLKDNRFAVITVGDVRDKKGFYYRFVDDIKDIFKKNGILLYNEMILVESIGTLPQRVGRFMEHRKIGKCHQNVLVFFKGDPKQIKTIYPKIEIQEDGSTNTQL
jgi:DNA modification methylase